MICPVRDDNLCQAWDEVMAHTNYTPLVKYYSDHPVLSSASYDTAIFIITPANARL